MCEPVSVVYHSTVPPAHQQLSTKDTHITTSTANVHNYLAGCTTDNANRMTLYLLATQQTKTDDSNSKFKMNPECMENMQQQNKHTHSWCIGTIVPAIVAQQRVPWWKPSYRPPANRLVTSSHPTAPSPAAAATILNNPIFLRKEDRYSFHTNNDRLSRHKRKVCVMFERDECRAVPATGGYLHATRHHSPPNISIDMQTACY